MAEKTEEPTPRRLQKAREQGDSPVSAALVQAVGFCAALALVPAALTATAARCAAHLQSALGGVRLSALGAALEVLLLSAPLLVAAAMASAAFGAVQSGGFVAFKRVAPDATRLNPLTGLRGLWNTQRGLSIVRALLAATLILGYAIRLFHDHGAEFAGVIGDLPLATSLALRLASRVAWFAALIGLALAVLDVLATRYAWRKRHRMSRDEVKREHRESEGDPEIKAARRRAHQEALAGVMIASVRQATVLIVNPTHLAVALHYVEEADEAPRVVAQGAGDLARRMIEAAHAYGVPVIRDVPVARALSELEVGDEIPELLYEAVATILREAWADSPQPPADGAH
ncbi:MAG TPA: EscU/YscU/HrcU family type III secretion system export apparatus switch protein [Polyangiaceae bacterium]|nr:EscU/YscU/HrcU family type III secretion system export apparatus switch protein [Polyangiaceae bacterium]